MKISQLDNNIVNEDAKDQGKKVESKIKTVIQSSSECTECDIESN